MFITTSRLPVIDYTAMTTATYSSFIFRSPPITSVANLYILPFDKTVWLFALFLVLISILGYYLTLYVSSRMIKRKTTELLSDSCLTIVSAVCQMGVESSLNKTSVKLIMVRKSSGCQFTINSLKISVFLVPKLLVPLLLLYCQYCVAVAIAI